MTKGNLNDLIRQEVEKEVESEPSIAPPLKPQRATNATLQTKITELTAQLENAEAQSLSLQERIQTLENDLQQQKDHFDRLQTEERKTSEEQAKILQNTIKTLENNLQQKQQLQTLLDEQTALVTQLSHQLQQSENELETSKHLVETLYSRIQTLETPPPPKPVSPKPTTPRPGLYNFEVRSLVRYVASAAASTELTDTDIGWFD